MIRGSVDTGYRLSLLDHWRQGGESRRAGRWLGIISIRLVPAARLLGTVWVFCASIRDCGAQHRPMSDMAALSDHMLHDIGLDRMDLRYGNRPIFFRHDM